MNNIAIETIILNFIHETTGWGSPLAPHCEFEELREVNIKDTVHGKKQISFTYTFDEDGFSQYDKTHTLKGEITIDTKSVIIVSYLEEINKGAGCTQKFTTNI